MTDGSNTKDDSGDIAGHSANAILFLYTVIVSNQAGFLHCLSRLKTLTLNHNVSSHPAGNTISL